VYHNQRAMTISVYESMTDVLTEELDEHIRLVEGELTGLPPGPKGQRVEVTFALGDDGILRTRAVAANKVELTLEARISGLIPDEMKKAPLPTIRR
jgi:molecular chaperone DnaK